MSYKLTRAAERDIRDILTYTLKVFGAHQLAAYTGIIEKGLAMIGDDPGRGGSIDRSGIAPGVRMFHLELAVGRRGAAAHCVYYTTGQMKSGGAGTAILRLLHEGMEPRHKVVSSLNSPVM